MNNCITNNYVYLERFTNNFKLQLGWFYFEVKFFCYNVGRNTRLFPVAVFRLNLGCATTVSRKEPRWKSISAMYRLHMGEQNSHVVWPIHSTITSRVCTLLYSILTEKFKGDLQHNISCIPCGFYWNDFNVLWTTNNWLMPRMAG